MSRVPFRKINGSENIIRLDHNIEFNNELLTSHNSQFTNPYRY